MGKKIKVAVIFGGQSGEHEVSLSSASGVMGAMNKEKYKIIPIAITKGGNWLIGERGAEYIEKFKHLAGKENAISQEESQSLVKNKEKKDLTNFFEGELKDKIDLVFPILHGPYGEDGRLQGMLDMLGIPYVFSGVLAHSLGMNKAKAKLVAEKKGVRVAKDLVLMRKTYKEDNLDELLEKIGLPMMVKPTELGSSVGISLVKEKGELEEAIKNAFSYGEEIIVEQYIKGRELTVTVMERSDWEDPKVLAVTEIIPQISEFYDYKAKYEEGGSKHICPVELSKESSDKIKKSAVAVFQSLGCKDLARTDFIWDEEKNEFYFIDINTIPGMTPTSLAPEAAREAGMNFTEFLDQLIEMNLKNSF